MINGEPLTPPPEAGRDATLPGAAFAARRRRVRRFFPIFLFVFAAILAFVGGSAALLYWLFTEYSGIRNVWLLICGAPVTLIVVIFLTIFNLYLRLGRPLEEILNAIDAAAEGDLSARAPENPSGLFSELTARFNKMVAELERADQQRRNLTADIAHELRTPLHILQGNLEGVLDGVYQPTPEHIQDTLEETRLLARLVNDLQTLSLAESGQLPLHPRRFQLAGLFEDLAASFSKQAAAQGVDLKANMPDAELEMTADYDRINQVLSNLLANALRHTPAGGRVTLEATRSPDPARGVQIIVEDTGEGIAAEDLPFIFDRFWRGDRSRKRGSHAASGLGLSIARHLVQAHGGRIEVESEVGVGTRFRVEGLEVWG